MESLLNPDSQDEAQDALESAVAVMDEEPTTAPTGEFDMSLDQEVLTDKTPTKTVPCRKCRRRCVVTLFATAAKTECNTCKGKTKGERKEQVQIKQAHTIDPATVDNLADALVNPVFKQVPLCPFDPEHTVELKSITHSPNYGPRKLDGYDKQGIPQYKQTTGESVMWQCNDCACVMSASTMHPVILKSQNEARHIQKSGTGVLEAMQGVRRPAPPLPSTDFGGDAIPPA